MDSILSRPWGEAGMKASLAQAEISRYPPNAKNIMISFPGIGKFQACTARRWRVVKELSGIRLKSIWPVTAQIASLSLTPQGCCRLPHQEQIGPHAYV